MSHPSQNNTFFLSRSAGNGAEESSSDASLTDYLNITDTNLLHAKRLPRRNTVASLVCTSLSVLLAVLALLALNCQCSSAGAACKQVKRRHAAASPAEEIGIEGKEGHVQIPEITFPDDQQREVDDNGLFEFEPPSKTGRRGTDTTLKTPSQQEQGEQEQGENGEDTEEKEKERKGKEKEKERTKRGKREKGVERQGKKEEKGEEKEEKEEKEENEDESELELAFSTLFPITPFFPFPSTNISKEEEDALEQSQILETALDLLDEDGLLALEGPPLPDKDQAVSEILASIVALEQQLDSARQDRSSRAQEAG